MSDIIGMVIGVLSTTSLVLLSVVSFEVDLFGGMMTTIHKRDMSLKTYNTCITRCTHGKDNQNKKISSFINIKATNHSLERRIT